ncbi:hypothetical protein PENSPDRAFT_106148 [Peniophora sp. CONT]|nr:hypothetical protein PENSPDRAFT_106148 [Peniophora sp. CONT]
MTSDTFSTLLDGHQDVPVHSYSPAEAKANIAPTAISFIESTVTVALLAAITLSAMCTRNVKDSTSFVRTSLVLCFVSVLASEALSAVSGILTTIWIVDMKVFSGTLCTVQGVLRHVSDVGLAIWTVVIAIQVFIILRRAQNFKEPVDNHPYTSVTIFGRTMPRAIFSKWTVLVTLWLAVGGIVTGGPVIAAITGRGDFYGVFDESCAIAASRYLPESIAFSSAIIILAAFLSITLFIWMSYYVIKPCPSESDAELEARFVGDVKARMIVLKAARYMAWLPLVYFICAMPTIIKTILFWSGVTVPVAYIIFAETIYHLIGVVDVAIFLLTSGTGLLLPIKSSTINVEPRDLNAEAERVRAQIAALVLAMQNETSPPASLLSSGSESSLPIAGRHPSTRAREAPFPLRARSADPSKQYHARSNGVRSSSAKPEEEPELTSHGENQDGAALDDRSESRQSDVPSSVYSQPSPTPSSPHCIVSPATATLVTPPSDPRPESVEVRVEDADKHPEVETGAEPPSPVSPDSPRTVPIVFNQVLAVAEVPNVPRSPSPSPDDVVELAPSTSRISKDQSEKWLQRIIHDIVSRRAVPMPWLPQRPNGEPDSPADSFMDPEAAAIERSHSELELSSMNLNSHSSSNLKRESHDWYAGFLQAAGLGAFASRRASKHQGKVHPDLEPRHSSPFVLPPIPDVATTWHQYEDSLKTPRGSVFIEPASPSTSSHSTTFGSDSATLQGSSESMTATWSLYTTVDLKEDNAGRVKTAAPAVFEPPVIVIDRALPASPVPTLGEEIFVAQMARRPVLSAQSVLLDAVQVNSKQALDAVLIKGAKSVKRRRAVSPLRATSLTGTTWKNESTPDSIHLATEGFDTETAWVCKMVPGEVDVWECEEKVVDVRE